MISVEKLSSDEYEVFKGGEYVGTVRFQIQTAAWAWEAGPDDVVIPVDSEQQAGLLQERIAIASQPDEAREALTAELEGRIVKFRDETVDMALIYGKAQANKL